MSDVRMQRCGKLYLIVFANFLGIYIRYGKYNVLKCIAQFLSAAYRRYFVCILSGINLHFSGANICTQIELWELIRMVT